MSGRLVHIMLGVTRAGWNRNPPPHPHVSPQQMVLEDGSLDAAPEHRLRHLLPPIKEALASYQA